MNITCKICKASVKELFKAEILNKYQVQYYKCTTCGFIQTEEPFWLNEAYSSAITALDIGLLHRNNTFLPVTMALINNFFDRDGKFIDYGGGYGVFTRMMRDKGYHFYRQDLYCENLFANHFDILDTKENSKAELITAFEVFEHLVDPCEEVKKMLQLADSVFFSTELSPPQVNSVHDWWYFIPTTGQHISIFSKRSLEVLAGNFGLKYYTNGRNLHLFTKKKINPFLFKVSMSYRLAKYLSLFNSSNSLLDVDYEAIKRIN